MARSFNGSTDEIQANTVGAAITQLSVACWAYPTSFSNAYLTAVNKTDASVSLNGNFFLAVKNTGRIVSECRTNSGFFATDNQAGLLYTVSLNQWQHIGFAMTNAGFGQFYNGLLDYSTAGDNFSGTQRSTIELGYFPPTPTISFIGALADIAVWNCGLSGGEFSGLAGGMRPDQLRQDKLVGWWPLDGIQSTEPDLSGKGNNGTLTGTAVAVGPPVNLFTQSMR